MQEAIIRFAPQFEGTEQHDSQEFISFLLDGLHEDLNLVLRRPPPTPEDPDQEAQFEQLPDWQASAIAWEKYLKRNSSVIVSLFQGQFRNRLVCLKCSTVSPHPSAHPKGLSLFMTSLTMPPPRHPPLTILSWLSRCLSLRTGVVLAKWRCSSALTTLSEKKPWKKMICGKILTLRHESYCLRHWMFVVIPFPFLINYFYARHCPKCKTLRKASKQLTLSKLPDVLMIHLKRFSFDGPFNDKLETMVDFPIQ